MIGTEATLLEDMKDSLGRIRGKKGANGIITTEPDRNGCVEFRPKGQLHIVKTPLTSLRLKPANAKK